MSQLEVDKIIPQSGTTLTIGDSGDTITIASGATLSGSLNADNLDSGTVPDGRITGAYTGITNLTMSGDLTVDTNTLFVDASENKVGVGTTTPLENLTVESSSFPIVAISNNSASNPTNGVALDLIERSTSGAVFGQNGVFGFRQFLDAQTNRFDIISGNQTTTNTRLSIERDTGNVGIGETNPDKQLEISSSTGGTLQLTNNSTSIGAGESLGEITFFSSDTSGDGTGVRGFIKSVENDGGTGRRYDLTFGTGNRASATEKLRIDKDGKVGIGTTSPLATLHVDTSNSGVTPNANADELFVENSGNSGITIGSGTGNAGQLCFGDSGDNDRGAIAYLHDVDAMRFTANGTEKMRIDSSGNTMFAKSTQGDVNVVGAEIRNNGLGTFTRDGDTVLIANRKSSDGTLLEFRKDNTAVGSIGVNASDNIYLSGNSSHAGIQFGSSSAIAFQNGSIVNNTLDLGASTHTWKDIYLGGGVYLGGTGSANKLDDYEEGLHEASLTPSASGSVNLGGNENTLSYVKIGHLVNVQGQLSVNTLSSPVGYIKISMPFTAASLTKNSDNSACSLLINNVNTATVGDFVGIVQNGTSELRIYLGDTTYANEDSAQELRIGTSIYLNVSYRTT